MSSLFILTIVLLGGEVLSMPVDHGVNANAIPSHGEPQLYPTVASSATIVDDRPLLRDIYESFRSDDMEVMRPSTPALPAAPTFNLDEPVDDLFELLDELLPEDPIEPMQIQNTDLAELSLRDTSRLSSESPETPITPAAPLSVPTSRAMSESRGHNEAREKKPSRKRERTPSSTIKKMSFDLKRSKLIRTIGEILGHYTSDWSKNRILTCATDLIFRMKQIPFYLRKEETGSSKFKRAKDLSNLIDSLREVFGFDEGVTHAEIFEETIDFLTHHRRAVAKMKCDSELS